MKIISLFLSFILGFFTYPISFLPMKIQEDFSVATGEFTQESIFLNGENASVDITGEYTFNTEGFLVFEDKVTLEFENTVCDWFNYYSLAFSADSHIKGVLGYRAGVKEKSEDFFLEKGDNIFSSFIDGTLDKVKANGICYISFEPLENESAAIRINGMSLFNRAVPEREIYISNEQYKIGVDLLWGGALSYMEDLNSNVQAVSKDGRIYVDSNASERYSAESVNNNVNLINRSDTGRLVQQSYYGTDAGDYECGEYMGNKWNYNPVQGGNQFNESSKIVDLRVDEKSIYIKCRPLDWAKSKEDITPSYMEAVYEFVNNTVHVSCRFVDFSGYPEAYTTQELPAFYCIEPFNRYVYYSGDKPWTNGALSCEPKLIFWPDAGYPNFTSTENWSAFIGEFDDSFGIGLFCPNETNFLAGVFNREQTVNTDPSKDGSTSYIALVKAMNFKSFVSTEYDYYLTTGGSSEIRNNFKEVK